MYMFLKQERPEVDDFERKKNFGCIGKIFKEYIRQNVYNGYPSKNFTTFFCTFYDFKKIFWENAFFTGGRGGGLNTKDTFFVEKN